MTDDIIHIERDTLEELANYARDDIVMNGVVDEDLENAVEDAYNVLYHDEE